MTTDQLSHTYGLHMDADELRAARFGLMDTHVAGDALCARSIVDGYEPLPLLHRAGHLGRDAQALLLNLSVEAVQVQVDDRAVVGVLALSSPAALHSTCIKRVLSAGHSPSRQDVAKITCCIRMDAGQQGDCRARIKHDAPASTWNRTS